jgi:membrane associated rhomboid family serine protease
MSDHHEVNPAGASVPAVGRATREPIINAPAVVIGLLGLLIAIHAGMAAWQWLGGGESAVWWSWALAFVPARYYGGVGDVPGGAIAAVTSFVTHTLLHNDIAHLLINGAWLLAFGAAVARRVGALRFLALYALSAVAGAVLYLVINGNADAVMIGASGAISGLFGGAFRFFFNSLEARRAGLSAEAAQFVPRMTLGEMAANPRVRSVIVMWIVINFVVAVATPILGGGIAWEAHLGGFLFGLLAFGWFDAPPRPPQLA